MLSLVSMVCFTNFVAVQSHSWMSCPPSFVMGIGRGGVTDHICDGDQVGNSAFVTNVHAGDRLKVGWVSNNHAGGYVRLALVPFGDHTSSVNFQNNILKFACYGHDYSPENRGRSKFGDCNHPCNARPGCEFQSEITDTERYDTTIGIPTNLADGDYVLQASLLVGNGHKPYYSCARLNILKGNPSFNCQSNVPPATYTCHKSNAGKILRDSDIFKNVKRGDFCYHLNGTIGGIDDKIRDIPMNVECDPRTSCANSVSQTCSTDNPTMSNILTDSIHPRQPVCRVFNTLPYARPSCYDDKQNRDEEGVDCGGTFCPNKCPTLPPFEGGDFDYYQRPIKQTLTINGNTFGFKLSVTITKDINDSKCWQLTLQYARPIQINQNPSLPPKGNDVWTDGALVFVNEQSNIFKIEKPEWASAPVKKGRVLNINFNGLKHPSDTNTKEWTESDMRPVTASFEVKDKKDCIINAL